MTENQDGNESKTHTLDTQRHIAYIIANQAIWLYSDWNGHEELFEIQAVAKRIANHTKQITFTHQFDFTMPPLILNFKLLQNLW